MNKIHRLYFCLRKKYGEPKEFWQEWCKRKKSIKDREKIAFGAILTQRTKWQNVEMALKNLEEAKALSIGQIYEIGKKNLGVLENLIKPAGFYKQKAKRIFLFCQFVIEEFGGLNEFFQQNIADCRKQLLALYGIGPETADSIILYAGQKPIFVIDHYTCVFVKKHKLGNTFSYQGLQTMFEKNLPRDIKIYQDFHAMIVLEGKSAN